MITVLQERISQCNTCLSYKPQIESQKEKKNEKIFFLAKFTYLWYLDYMFQKLERSSSKGYQLIDFGSHWEMHSSKGIYRGGFRQVCTYAVLELGFSMKELEIGVVEMEKTFHNGAEFGIFKRFMYTFDKENNSALH